MKKIYHQLKLIVSVLILSVSLCNSIKAQDYTILFPASYVNTNSYSEGTYTIASTPANMDIQNQLYTYSNLTLSLTTTSGNFKLKSLDFPNLSGSGVTIRIQAQKSGVNFGTPIYASATGTVFGTTDFNNIDKIVISYFSGTNSIQIDNIDLDNPVLPPTVSSFIPASGPVGTPITITGTNLSTLTSVTIGGVAAIPISNTGTQLVAMVMPGAATGIISVTTPASTANSATSFSITTTTPPTTQQGSKLVGTGNTGAANQGNSVSVSADGNTAIIGGYADNSNVGSVWVFIRSTGVWTQQGAKLVGTGNTVNSVQGFSVSLSADGNTAMIGGYLDNSNIGAAWVFTRSAGVWTQQGAKLVGTGSVGASYQGTSVSLSADGNTAIIGGQGDNTDMGAAWVFTRSAGVWTQQGLKLVGTGSTGNANQGRSVSLSADGNTAIVGGYGDNSLIGAAWVFTRSAGVWTQQGAKLVGTGNAGASYQGTSVSLSADGNTAIIGGRGDNTNLGAVWVFTRSAGIWTQQGAKLVGTGSIGSSQQGRSVSLSADGNKAMIGGQVDNSNMGAVWVFTRSAGIWTQQGLKLVGTGNIGSSQQGMSVSLSADGNTAMIGGNNDNGSLGAAWAFNGSLSTLAVNLLTFSGRNNGADNLLQWITTAEQNSDYFDIERSVDGINFSKAGTTASQGNSVSNRTYTFSDNITGLSSQLYYYRLKIVDISGTFKYSAIVKIKLNSHAFNVTAGPNPFTEKLNVSVETMENGKATIQLNSITGNTIQLKNVLLQKGFNTVTFDQLQDLPAGVYIIKVNAGTAQQTIKIIK